MGPFQGIDTIELLTTAMKVAQTNHRIIANNLANVDTPGFNPVQLDFQRTLRQALMGRGRISLRRTRAQHIDAQRFRPVIESVVIGSKNDYNKVDMDREITNLSKNTGRYTLFGSLVVKRFQTIKSMLNNER